MKRVLKQQEPTELARFRDKDPQSTWQQMKDDANFGGSEAYVACRTQLLEDQGGICAFCEIGIHDNDPLKCRVEHFHPKSDISPAHNWALDWNNLLAVCAGGSYRFGATPHTQEPLAENLSCDAYKDQMIQSGRLSDQCEGWILNPTQLLAAPNVFQLEKSTGRLLPDNSSCAMAPNWPGNQHSSIQALVQHTIDMLNLNCDRLCQARLVIIRDVERNKKRQRDQGYSAEQGLSNLVTRYFRQDWPEFFTTIRICLGAAAEAHLLNIAFQG